MAVLMGIGLPFAVHMINDIDNIGLEVSTITYCVIIVIGFVLGMASSLAATKNGPIDNWTTWSSVVNNKTLAGVVFIFTLSPTIVKTTNIIDPNMNLSLIFYGYWFCGLFMFIFIILYKILAPKIFQYKDFDDFYSRSDTFTHLRSDARHISEKLEAKKKKGPLAPYQAEFYNDTIKTLGEIENNKITSAQDAFKVMRLASAHFYTFKRSFVALPLIIPIYFLPLVLTANISIVANEAAEKIEDIPSITKHMFSGD